MPSGEISSGRKAKAHPLDWYVEQGWEWEQVVAEIGLEAEILGGAAIWDPACGFGHSISRLQGMGFRGPTLLSDLVDNVARDDFDTPPEFHSWDFLELYEPPFDRCSIFCNPPYSYKKGILEAFVRQALRLATHRVVILAPLKWLAAGRGRAPLFRRDHPPQSILYFTTRPSMPPGDRIHLMGGRAYRGGMIDYVALVWDVRAPTAPGETRSVWLPRLGSFETPAPRAPQDERRPG